MKVSELSARSGATVQTIKFYLREGLLPKGVSTGATSALYGEEHLERLRLIRVLREVGGLPVAAIQKICAAVDDESVGAHDLYGTAQYALGPHIEKPDDPDWRRAARDVDALIAELGWRVTAHAPARAQLTQTFVALRDLGLPMAMADLRPYVEAATSVAEREISRIRPGQSRTEAVRGMLATTILYERLLIALHRLAQENASAALTSGEE